MSCNEALTVLLTVVALVEWRERVCCRSSKEIAENSFDDGIPVVVLENIWSSLKVKKVRGKLNEFLVQKLI